MAALVVHFDLTMAACSLFDTDNQHAGKAEDMQGCAVQVKGKKAEPRPSEQSVSQHPEPSCRRADLWIVFGAILVNNN